LILESLSAGLPLVAAPQGAAFEHVVNSHAGWLMPDLTVEALISTLIEALGAVSDEHKRRARAYALTHSWSQCFQNQKKLYLSGL
jgi:alpha-1,6-mannosyltransferase